ncbi:OTU domain-containing 7B-like isoform X1 [Brachionus plicatilis]|uniref:ubiquitinyl hydrolase 1 n=1 Tax=Brachionus plicatilis TaxID=10195 RepID=A0A3M7RL89_BRAPC|nr:OTU domain-containing 7B-like isoform X1 [Brachionus plicatilis]
MHSSTDNGHKQPQFSRGYSKVVANEEITHNLRSKIEKSFKSDTLSSSSSTSSTNNSRLYIQNEYSFMLPDLNQVKDYKFREYLHSDLIEMPTEYALTESGHLNWWTQNEWEGVCKPLYPMSTSGDGNCLLHAASLSMWGLHDRSLVLRKALHSTLENLKENQSALWRRWKWEQMCQNKKLNLIYSDEEWSSEWNALLKLSSYKPRVSLDSIAQKESANLVNQEGQVYFESLEEFHVFLLAHILQRPIIIVSDTMLHDSDGQPLAPIPFGGIYLPVECEPESCQRFPLVLAYDSAHFSALVLMNDHDLDYSAMRYPNIAELNKILQNRAPYSCIPITYSNGEILPVHFTFDPGENFDWSKFEATNPLSQDQEMFLIQKYLDLVRIELQDSAVVMKKNLPTNTSGCKISICNIKVNEPYRVQQSRATKIQKFFSNMFKLKQGENKYEQSLLGKNFGKTMNANSLMKSLKGGKIVSKDENRPETLDQNGQPEFLSYSKVAEGIGTTEPDQTIFHKVKHFNCWSDVFSWLYARNNYQKNMLCCKLNLIKPPKYDFIIGNYIESESQKYRLLVKQSEEQKARPIHHSQEIPVSHVNGDSQGIRSIHIKNTFKIDNPVQYSYNQQHDQRQRSSYY